MTAHLNGKAAFERSEAKPVAVDVIAEKIPAELRDRPQWVCWRYELITDRSGAKRWSFDPVPRRADDPAAATWNGGSYLLAAGGSAWAAMSADPERDLVFLPTASPTAAFYGGERAFPDRASRHLGL